MSDETLVEVAETAPADTLLAPQQADAEALAEVYRQGVDVAAPSPGAGEYVRDTIIYSLTRFFGWLEEMSGAFGWLNWDLVRIALTGLLLALVGWLLFRVVRRFLANRTEVVGDGHVAVETPRRPAPASRDWAEELRRRLEAGDVASALEALWWWLATQVGVPDADPSWTSRELLLHAGRGDLRRPVRRLDHMIYGPEAPAIVDVREFWHGLRPYVTPNRSASSASEPTVTTGDAP